jgi:hypothetical protein
VLYFIHSKIWKHKDMQCALINFIHKISIPMKNTPSYIFYKFQNSFSSYLFLLLLLLLLFFNDKLTVITIEKSWINRNKFKYSQNKINHISSTATATQHRERRTTRTCFFQTRFQYFPSERDEAESIPH